MPGEDGKTKREKSPLTDYPVAEIPSAAAFVWPTFWEINQGRQSGMGFSPLSFSEIESWSHLSGVQLGSVELRLLKAMDMALVGFVNRSSSQSLSGEKKGGRTMVSVNDSEGLKNMFGRIQGKRG